MPYSIPLTQLLPDSYGKGVIASISSLVGTFSRRVKRVPLLFTTFAKEEID